MAFSLFLTCLVLVGHFQSFRHIFHPAETCLWSKLSSTSGNLSLLQHCFHQVLLSLLTPSWTSAGSYWGSAMPEDVEVTGWDEVIMYPTAQLVSCRTLYSLIPCLPALLLLHCCKALNFRDRDSALSMP